MRIAAGVLAVLLALPAFAAREKRIDPQPKQQTREKSVTLDVKDEETRAVLKSMQQQCAIKNLILDPDVEGKATFYFRDVPCHTAFDTVLKTLGLKAVVDSNTVTTVERLQ